TCLVTGRFRFACLTDTFLSLVRARPALLLLFCLGLRAPCAHAAVITVTNTNDNGPGSLRQAIQNAARGATINCSITGVITLTNGELLITKDMTIIGPGAAKLSISDNNSSRAVQFASKLPAVTSVPWI